ncbi:MAG: NADP-dependent phosphogluconate dehydrogenase [Gammaproteobacteria bacterium]|nr:NADP-dependent phosphogluconate dehydrogenase [Gammaproteobacteria bacterium]
MTASQIGLIGLGTMGSALALNIAEKGHRIAVFNRTSSVTDQFLQEAGSLAANITGTLSLEALVEAIESPRAIILMVPAGNVVDAQIAALKPLLSDDDLIIDAGNANFRDTQRRSDEAEGYQFMGMGVSGGEEGARHGPAIMAGGPKTHWQRVEPILTAISAKHDDEPCANWMGEGGAGHFVKMVHNGIEYADMQMIAEVYGIYRDGMGRSCQDIAPIFAKWNKGPLKSYLVEISAAVAASTDTESRQPLLDIIVDAAGQKGTGRWTAIEAQHLAAAVPSIEAAVAARNLSALREARAEGEALFGPAPKMLADNIPDDLLEDALIAGKILCYAQGFEMMAQAAAHFGWTLDMPTVARNWREGCIIRSSMLDDMASSLAESAERNLMFAPHFAAMLESRHQALRQVVATAMLHGIAVPALASGLTYFDTMRTARGTANMIQGQRDYFGLHGFERFDGRKGQHGPWADD